jgi:hypothetical protein
MATEKLQHWPWMLRHVAVYMVLITVIIVGYAWTHSLAPWLVAAALVFVAVTHVLLDRRKLTASWMRLVGISPDRLWLSIVVDQVFHLLTLALVAQVLTMASG